MRKKADEGGKEKEERREIWEEKVREEGEKGEGSRKKRKRRRNGGRGESRRGE